MIEIWIADFDHKRIAITHTHNIAQYDTWHDIEDIATLRTAMHVLYWMAVCGGNTQASGNAMKTPVGYLISNGRDLKFTLFKDYLDIARKYEDMTMLHIAVVDETTDNSMPTNLSLYRTYYIVEKQSDIHEDHENACRLLDAAANEDGISHIDGLGSRIAVVGMSDVHYVLSSEYIERHSDGHGDGSTDA